MARAIPTRRVAARGVSRQRSELWRQVWAARWCYAFMLPSLVLTSMFSLYPTVASWYFSLFEWTGITNAMY